MFNPVRLRHGRSCNVKCRPGGESLLMSREEPAVRKRIYRQDCPLQGAYEPPSGCCPNQWQDNPEDEVFWVHTADQESERRHLRFHSGGGENQRKKGREPLTAGFKLEEREWTFIALLQVI